MTTELKKGCGLSTRPILLLRYHQIHTKEELREFLSDPGSIRKLRLDTGFGVAMTNEVFRFCEMAEPYLPVESKQVKLERRIAAAITLLQANGYSVRKIES